MNSKGVDLTGIAWVQLCAVDVFGSTHAMLLPASRFSAAVAGGELFDGSALEGRGRLIETDMRLRPDPGSLIRLGGGLARVECMVLDASGAPWPGDPRNALARAVEQTRPVGAEYRASAELEFYLLDADGLPVDEGGYFDQSEDLGMRIARDAADRLAGFGVAIESVHHEAGPGQYELDLPSLPALALADAIILAKRTIRETAEAADVRATFMPRPLAGEAGSGLHLHQRVGTRLARPDGELTDEGRHFLAGQLEHARALTALAAPTVNSYKRLHSGPEAPAAAVWARVNRGALLRLSPNMAGGPTLEFRAADPSANPYTLIAALIVAGEAGMRAGLELAPAYEEEADGFDPAAHDSARFELLPRDLDEAMAALLVDDVVVDAFDSQLISRLADGRRAEAAEYRAQVTPWEIERYVDQA